VVDFNRVNEINEVGMAAANLVRDIADAFAGCGIK
jgi:hypothetical protein